MNAPFFITGPPRCRSAWLANLLTTDHSHCFHDLLATIPPEQLPEFLCNDWMGLSDASLLVHFDAVNRIFPEARWVLVNRPFDEAWRSFEVFVGEAPWLRVTTGREMEASRAAVANGVRRITATIPPTRLFRVNFEALDSIAILRALWAFCLSNLPFNEFRANMLQTLNIQQERRKVAPGRP